MEVLLYFVPHSSCITIPPSPFSLKARRLCLGHTSEPDGDKWRRGRSFANIFDGSTLRDSGNFFVNCYGAVEPRDLAKNWGIHKIRPRIQLQMIGVQTLCMPFWSRAVRPYLFCVFVCLYVLWKSGCHFE